MYIYVGQYGTADAGALQVQVPAGTGDANIDSSETLAYTLILADVKQNPVRQIKNFALSQNYPNPFNPSTVINYQIPEDGKVTLKVYDILGTQVAELVNEDQSMGMHYAQFNAMKVSSGIYYYTLTSGSHKETKKMMVLK